MAPAVRRWLIRILVALAILVGVPLLANVYAFYGTADFEPYLEANPVADETLAALLPTGTTALTDGRSWMVGSRDPFAEPEGEQEDGRITWTGRTTFRVLRGKEVLGHARVEARATSPDGTVRDGFGVRITQLASSENLRAVVVARLDDPDRVVGPESAARGHLDTELLLVAGEGSDEVRLVTGGTLRPMAPGSFGFGPAEVLGLWLRLLLPLQSPPEEGFWLHLRYGFGLSAEQRDGSSSSGALDLGSFESSTDLYSFEARVDQELFADPDSKFTSEGTVRVERNLFGTLK